MVEPIDRMITNTSQQEDEQPFFDLGDTIAAPFRGIEGAAQDLYGLFDTLVGDALPDYDERFLGESRSTVGGLIEGISQFATGFIPVAGQLGKVGFLAKSPLLKAAAAGAITDFAFFDGHESRLSDLVQQYPALQNPISEYLASDEDDSELEGRFKASLEGVGIGAFTDTAFLGLKRFKAISKAKDAGASAEEALAAGNKAVSDDVINENISANTTTTNKASDAIEVDDAVFREFTDNADLNQNTDFTLAPRDQTETQRLVNGLNEKSLHLANITDEKTAAAYIRSAGQIADKGDIPEAVTEDLLVGLAKEHSDVNGGDLNVLIARLKGAKDQQRTLTIQGLVAKDALDKQGKFFSELVSEKLKGGDLSQLGVQDLADIYEQTSKFAGLTRAYRDWGSEVGLSLKSRQTKVDLVLGSRDEAGKFVPVKPPKNPQDLDRWLAQQGGRKEVERNIEALTTALKEGDAAGAKMGQLGIGSRAVKISTEYWMNAILSGPKTHAVNVMSNSFATVYRPVEALLGNAVRSVGDVVTKGSIQESTREIWGDLAREMTGLYQAIPDAFRASKLALKQNEGVLFPGSNRLEVKGASQQALTAKNVGLEDSSFLGGMVNFLGNTITTPGRLLTTGDEFFKQLNFRSSANSNIFKRAQKLISEGRLRPEDQAEWIVNTRERFFREGQAFSASNAYKEGVEHAKRSGAQTSEEITAGALDYIRNNEDDIRALTDISNTAREAAEEATFTSPLGIQGGFVDEAAAKLQGMTISHPTLRFVVPFVRTPTNLLKFAARRLDIPHFVMSGSYLKRARKMGLGGTEKIANRFKSDLLSGDARKKTEALGRLSAGTGAMFFFMNQAASGEITGRGPENPAQRKVLEESGWQPYSIKTDDGYVSYQRFDPFASIIGSVVDLTQYGKYADVSDQSTVETGMSAVLFAFANNFTNKSYLTGMENMISLLSKPEQRSERFINRFGGSFIPSVVSQSVTAVDGDTTREVQGLMDTLMSRTPGWSKDLPPVRNVLGKPVEKVTSLGYDSVGQVMDMFLPIAYTEVNDDVVTKEMANLRWAFTPPRSTRGGVDMREFKSASNQDAYDRMMELQGTLKFNGRTLQDQLRKTIQSDFYSRQSDQPDLEFEPPRVKTLKRIIRRYNRAAFRKVLGEFPEYRAAYIQVRQRKRDSFRGNLAPLNRLT